MRRVTGVWTWKTDNFSLLQPRDCNFKSAVNISNEHFLCFQNYLQKPNFLFAINSLPDDKILDIIKLKAFADDKINVGQMMISVYDRVQNIVEKGQNADNQHFLHFPEHFQYLGFFLGVNKSQDCVVKS